jgi:hypothetical protein
MKFLKNLFSSGGSASGVSPLKLQEAIEREADKAHHPPAWYKIEEIYVRKQNPITDYKVILSQQDPPP